MAEQEEVVPSKNPLDKLNSKQKISLAAGIAALLSIFVGMWLWGQETEYKLLYSNLTDRDGGAIIESLQQQNIPYKFSEGGGSLLIPAEKVHEVRLKLAAEGLPKGGSAGFELMENQKFGTTQFAEQVNYQRALEGELARSVEKIDSVAGARVHLAIPKPTVFVKEKQKPSASVVINLRRGRVLEPAQVSAIIHLISSSVPELSAQNISVVDQNGNLLSADREGINGELNTTQLKYIRQIEQDYVKRIENLLQPLFGAENIRAQVTADLDFSRTEQTAELFKPNLDPKEAAVRSQQNHESRNGNRLDANGIPGAFSNQPPAPASAPIVTNANTPVGANSNGDNQDISSLQKESTVNYEVDRTIRHTVAPVGSIRRLTVAVMLNGDRMVTDDKGKVGKKPVSPEEEEKINKLIRDAVGFDQNRGDNLNVQVIGFNEINQPVEEVAFWKDLNNQDLIKEIAKYLIIGGIILVIILKIIKPALAPLLPQPEKKEEEEEDTVANEANNAEAEEESPAAIYEPSKEPPAHEQSIQIAKQITQQDPKIVASVLKDWVKE